MKNHVKPGHTVTVPAPTGGVLSGAPVLVGSLFGVASYSAAEGADVEIVTIDVFDLPKAAGAAFAIGDKVYYDTTAKNMTATASGNKLVGSAAGIAASGDATARVRLPGMVIA